jgi:hypothetical protein
VFTALRHQDLAEAAERPAFREILDLLTTICGAAPRAWKRRKGVFQATVKHFDALWTAEPLPSVIEKGGCALAVA